MVCQMLNEFLCRYGGRGGGRGQARGRFPNGLSSKSLKVHELFFQLYIFPEFKNPERTSDLLIINLFNQIKNQVWGIMY